MTSTYDAAGQHLVSIFNQDSLFTLTSKNPQQLKQIGKGKSLAVQEVVIEAVLTVEPWQRQ